MDRVKVFGMGSVMDGDLVHWMEYPMEMAKVDWRGSQKVAELVLLRDSQKVM